MLWRNDFIFYPYFENDMPSEKPPTLFAILNAYHNFMKDDRVKIKDIAKMSTGLVFDFDYPISEFLDKQTFETAWINHFLQRRIGTETFTAFQLELMAKMNEIMPYYNMLFDNLGEKFNFWLGDGYTLDIVEDTKKNEQTQEDGSNENASSSHTQSETINDNRYSDTPQNHLENVQSGEYVTDYRYDTANLDTQTNGSFNGSDTRNRNLDGTENKVRSEIKKSNTSHRIEDIIRWQNEAKPIMTKIYRDCDSLFYQLF